MKNKRKRQKKQSLPENRPVSAVAKYVQHKMDEEFAALGGLNDFVIQRISFWTKEILKCPHFKLFIHYETQPKKIIIQIRDKEGNPTGEVPEKAGSYEQLREWLGIGEYKIEFEGEKDD